MHLLFSVLSGNYRIIVLQQEGATALRNMGVSETEQSPAFTQSEGCHCDYSSRLCPEALQEEIV